MPVVRVSRLVVLQCGRLDALLVHRDDFLGPLGRDGHAVAGIALLHAVRHGACQGVHLEQVVIRLLRLQHHLPRRHVAVGVDVLVHLVVHAASQFGALSRHLLRVGRQVLQSCGGRVDAVEVAQPRGAAQLASAGSESPYASRLLACPYLLHLDAHVEGCRQVLDQLSEVHASVRDVVEDGLLSVALELHVANLHLQSQILGYLSALYHRLVLASLGLRVFLQVHLAGQAVDAPWLLALLERRLPHLQPHESSRQRDDAYVVSRRGLHGHYVALVYVQVVGVAVVSLSCVLELHLHEVACLFVVREVGHVVVHVVLACVASAALAYQSASAVTGDVSLLHVCCRLFPYQYCHLDGHVVEDHPCVHVLFYVALRQ